MPQWLPYKLHSLGDSAVVIAFGDTIDDQVNRYIIAVYEKLLLIKPVFITDMMPAYCSLTVFYALSAVNQIKPVYANGYDYVCSYLDNILKPGFDINAQEEKTVTKFPVCYDVELAPDIEGLAKTRQVSINEIIRIHTAKKYRVYMIGFLPGFAYMGQVDEAIAAPRKKLPQPVKAGSVGIAGSQTGIYPIDSPGGWHIIGRTPIPLFDVTKQDPVLLKAGSIVQFYSITLHEYQHY